MSSSATEMLLQGRKLIDPVMYAHGFTWGQLGKGNSSGGDFDSGHYYKDDRSLELHYRNGLGLITYTIGGLSLGHEDYMRYAAPKGAAQYPGYSDNPLDGFAHLAHDLATHANDFLAGIGNEFRAAKAAAATRELRTGFRALSST